MTRPCHRRLTRHVEQWSSICRKNGRKWLPRLAYHFTDVQNAAAILVDHEILCRDLARKRRRMRVDNASPEIIADTPLAHQEFVRLYFRPRTPTQFVNEGIIAPEQRGYGGAHCPVPVFFCFDLHALLMRPDALFSNGSMARPEVAYGSTVELFDSIPFDLVYHDGPLSSVEKSKVIFHRHAEVLVPRSLPLTDLVTVACRSVAERQTLMNLAGGAASPWVRKIQTVGDPLFFRLGTYVTNVYSDGDSLTIERSPSRPPRPVKMRIEVDETGTDRSWDWAGTLTGTKIRIQLSDRPGQATTRVWFWDALAYQDRLDFTDDIPF